MKIIIITIEIQKQEASKPRWLKRVFHGPTNRADERHKTADLLAKYLGGADDLLSLPTNIDNLSIVLCSPIRH